MECSPRKLRVRVAAMSSGRAVLELDLPMPPRELSPNYRGHWAQIAGYKKDYRDHCLVLAKSVMWRAKGKYPLPGPVVAEVTFTFPNHRRRDQDNVLAALKAAWDGCVDAGLLADDKLPDFRVEPQPEEYRKGVSSVRVRLVTRTK